MSIKKTIITTVLTLALVALVAPAVTQADALSDALAQLAQLQAQIAGLQGTGTTAGTGACAGVTFTRVLVVGSTGSDVKCLQQILSVTPMSGYFGPITLAAVKVYQAQHGFIPANQVGPKTMAALNASIAGVTPPPVGGTYPAGCTSASGYSVTTGLACSGGVLPVGCTSTSGYSSATGLPCSGGAPVVPGTPTEGFITVSSLAAAPASNANIIATSNVPVLGVNVKAINSNMTVGSVKLQLAIASGEHPSTLVQKLYVYDGTTLLNSYPITAGSVIKTGSDYYVILTGTNFSVPAGQTKALTISADFNAGLETNRQLIVNLYGTTDAIRATDSLGLNSNAGLASSYNRIYTIKYATVGSSTLTVTANTGTPVSTSVNVNVDNGVTDVPMLVFNAKSTTGASKITDLTFGVEGIDAGMLDKVDAIKLYDGLTLLGSVSLTGAGKSRTAVFTDLAIPVAKDTTKNLLVRADIAGGVTSLDTLYVTIAPITQITYEQPDLTTGVAAVGSTITGKTMYVFNGKAAIVSFVSGTATYTYNATTPANSYTTGIITLKVKADGGLITKPLTADFDVYAFTDGSSDGLVDSEDITVIPNTDISDLSEATVVINVSETRGSSGVGFVSFKLGDDATTGVDWVIDRGAPVTQFWGLEDYKTPSVNVQ